MEFFKGTKIHDFMGKSKLFLALSAFLMLASYALLFTKGLHFGIDFAGGTIVQVKYDGVAPIDKIRDIVRSDKRFEKATVTKFGSDNEAIIRIPTSTTSVAKDIGDVMRGLLKDSGKFEVRRTEMVGPKVGNELKEKGLMAMGLSILAILIYVAFRFEWRFAVASIFALVHDVSIAMGALALFQVDVNLDILAALLTILGYSLNDTIIVFDRIREGIRESKVFDLFTIINESITKTLSRTTLTSLTTFFVVLTLFLFGGEIIYGFSFTMLVGVVVGTYSSIFVASPFLKWLGFSVEDFKSKEALKEKARIEKEKLRAQFEGGVV
jgi:preprotein translocase subunit SecF